jgi:hypothetical protein
MGFWENVFKFIVGAVLAAMFVAVGAVWCAGAYDIARSLLAG